MHTSPPAGPVSHVVVTLQGGSCNKPILPSFFESNDRNWSAKVNPGQCVILVDAGVFFIDQPNHHIWIDNLFIRFASNVAVDDSDTAPAVNGDNLSGDPRGVVVSDAGAAVYGTALSFMVGINSRLGGFKVAALWDDASTVLFDSAHTPPQPAASMHGPAVTVMHVRGHSRCFVRGTALEWRRMAGTGATRPACGGVHAWSMRMAPPRPPHLLAVMHGVPYNCVPFHTSPLPYSLSGGGPAHDVPSPGVFQAANAGA